MEKRRAKIENWSVVGSVVLGGYRELEPGQRLTGQVLGHTNLPNGIIYTSAILSIDWDNRLIETRNTVYELGDADPDYERWSADRRQARTDGEIRAA
ncbi:MAG: hypothetical protein WB974_06790 [Acidobacteriaceae bacterium]